MGFTKELFDALRSLGALEKRTQDVATRMESLSGKLENILERLAKIETRQDYLQQNVRNSILADIKADIVRTQGLLDGASREVPRLPRDGGA